MILNWRQPFMEDWKTNCDERQMVTTLNGRRHPLEMIFGGKQPQMEVELWWKKLTMENKLCWKKTFNGRQPFMKDFLWSNNCNKSSHINLSLCLKMEDRKLSYLTKVWHWRTNPCCLPCSILKISKKVTRLIRDGLKKNAWNFPLRVQTHLASTLNGKNMV